MHKPSRASDPSALPYVAAPELKNRRVLRQSQSSDVRTTSLQQAGCTLYFFVYCDFAQAIFEAVAAGHFSLVDATRTY
jgi:hypothetical protein